MKQDFPLAKRQYDLAIATSGMSQEADVPVRLALLALSAHEYCVKLWLSLEKYWRDEEFSESNPSRSEVPEPSVLIEAGRPVPSSHIAGKKTVADVVISHLLSWESLAILVLTVALTKLLQLRRTRR